MLHALGLIELALTLDLCIFVFFFLKRELSVLYTHLNTRVVNLQRPAVPVISYRRFGCHLAARN